MQNNSSSQASAPRVVLVGIGGYARRHLEMINDLGDKIRLVGAIILPHEYNTPEANSLRSRGVKIHTEFGSLKSAFSGLVDLCVIPTGIPLHADMAVGALQAGCNVLLEKPLAGSTADAFRIIQAENATKRWVALGFQDVYSIGVRRLKNRLLEGAIGRIRKVRILTMGARPDSYFKRNSWAGKIHLNGTKVNDSPLNNAFAHLLNLGLYFAGSSIEKSASFSPLTGVLLRAKEIESFDTSVVKAETTDGIILWIGASHACLVKEETILRIEGESGYVDWKKGMSYQVYKDDKLVEVFDLDPDREIRKAMYHAVIDRISSNSVRICDTRIGFAHVDLIEKIHDRFPIHNVSKEHLAIEYDETRGNQKNIYIKCLEEQLRSAFKSESLAGFERLIEGGE